MDKIEENKIKEGLHKEKHEKLTKKMSEMSNLSIEDMKLGEVMMDLIGKMNEIKEDKHREIIMSGALLAAICKANLDNNKKLFIAERIRWDVMKEVDMAELNAKMVFKLMEQDVTS